MTVEAYRPAEAPTWKSIAVLAARLIFAVMFAMAAAFKFADMGMTGDYIAGAGFPFPLFLAWCAALFEVLLVIAFLTGAYLPEASLLAALYVLFLGFAFHGSSHWGSDQIGQMEFAAFVSHFPFAAGLLMAAAHGPGRWAVNRSLLQSFG